MKRTPLARKTPLVATVKTVRAVGKKNPRPPRNTGPSAATRKAVIERAAGRCERCGKTITGDYSIHHRKPRGMGGTKDPVANSPANLILLCGSATSPDGCHTTVERFRRSAMATGFIVARTADPSKVPVKRHDGWVILNTDATTTTTTERPADGPEPVP